MYKVKVAFNDLEDRSYRYEVGDDFPRKGKIVSEARLDLLVSDKNRRGIALIEKVEEAEPAKVEEKPVKAAETKKKTPAKKSAAKKTQK